VQIELSQIEQYFPATTIIFLTFSRTKLKSHLSSSTNATNTIVFTPNVTAKLVTHNYVNFCARTGYRHYEEDASAAEAAARRNHGSIQHLPSSIVAEEEAAEDDGTVLNDSDEIVGPPVDVVDDDANDTNNASNLKYLHGIKFIPANLSLTRFFLASL